MNATVSLVASCLGITAMIIVFVATWTFGSSRWKPRITITLACLGVLAMSITRVLGIADPDPGFFQGVFVGFGVSAFLVSIMLPRRLVS
jgi:hypothetical protein